jgi:tetratricopeptide (TPR) repeat protein
MKSAIGVFTLLFCASLQLIAQESQQPPPARLVALIAGTGIHHHPISTKSSEAQKFFDQGLILNFGFNHDEAVLFFRRAIELDPEAAMPYWGVAWALGPRYALTAVTPGSDILLDVDFGRERAAYEAVQRALTMSAHAPPNERRYIEALARRYSRDPNPNRKQLLSDYKDAMNLLVRQYPDDLDAQVLYAESLMLRRPWQLWKSNGTPQEGTEEVVSVLEGVLSRDPQHPGANHYYVHAVEGSQQLERALPSAQRLMTLVPAAGHLLHMPAHIFFQTGEYEDLAVTNEHAVKADEDYMERAGTVGVYPLMFYTHNLHFIAVGRAAQGRYAEAKAAADRLAAFAGPRVKDMQMEECFAAMPLLVQLRLQRWDEILATPAPDSTWLTANALWHFARGTAFAARGKVEDASRERELFEAARKLVPPSALYVNGNNSAENVLRVAAIVLDARLATDPISAVQLWRRAVQTQDGLTYDEPPPWYYPIRESLGAALLRAGQPVEAEAVFREDLKSHRRNGRSLFGLMESLKAQNKSTDAEWVRKEFEAAWQGDSLRLENLY